MTPTDGLAPAAGHTDAPDAREGLRGLLGDRYGAFATALLHSAERLAEVTAERDALAASVARVREGHTPYPDYLPGPNGVPIRWERCQGCNGAYPCQPIRALDGSES